MATENVCPIHADQLGQGIQFEGVGEGLGENISGLVVGSDVADVKTLGKHKPQKANVS